MYTLDQVQTIDPKGQGPDQTVKMHNLPNALRLYMKVSQIYVFISTYITKYITFQIYLFT